MCGIAGYVAPGPVPANLAGKRPRAMNVLVLYDRRSTFTNTVFEHLSAFAAHSRHRHLFLDGADDFAIDGVPQAFDAVVVHYSVRVAFGQLSDGLMRRLAGYAGRKLLFVQDEYDMTERTRRTIEELGIDTVFTVVPERHRELVYPAARFPRVRFVTTLTGFVPMDRPAAHALPPLAGRPLQIGYRGRALPYWYGDLGQEKQSIGLAMRRECERRGLRCDIEWEEKRRIYGAAWTRFLLSCRATLGSESGSNRFDADGSVQRAVREQLARRPGASYAEVRRAVWGDAPEIPVMNQVSPRVFEAAALKTALVLYEGDYSGVVRPEEHFIALRKDHANADDVFRRLADTAGLQRMVERAYADVIESGRYAYAAFVADYDRALDADSVTASAGSLPADARLTAHPLRYQPTAAFRMLVRAWLGVPESARAKLRPISRRLRRMLDS